MNRTMGKGLKNLVGNTPLLAVSCEYRGHARTIYAKAEHINLTGSIKDRMAFHILERARTVGRLAPGQPIAEAMVPRKGSPDVFGAKFLGLDASPATRESFIEALRKAGL